MKQERFNPYIWVTWLTKLISGEQQCEFQSWFKAHYKYDKKPTDFNLTKWMISHNQLLHKRRNELEKKGYTVKIEDQNSFCLYHPRGITISGKADIVALGNMNRNTVEDCKTGKYRNSDQVQVMLYMMFLPKCIKEYKKIKFDGTVVYKDDVKVPIFWTDIDSNLKTVVWDVIKRIGADKPCRKTPSRSECNFCDISKDDCPEKVEE